METRSYSVGTKLAEGPLGALHEGTNSQTQERVLLRILPASLNKDGKALARLKGLKKSLNRFMTGQSQGDPSARPDPVLPALLEYGTMAGGLVFLASELVQGEPLVEQRRRSMGLPLPNKALRVGRQVATCLTLAHSASLLHLRLSPSKILVGGGSGDGEQVKLLELGIAPALLELLPGGVTSDVPSKEERAYLAPEQRSGELGGAAADVFALGVILYELTPVHSQTTRCSIFRALFAMIGALFATKHTTITGCACFNFSSLNGSKNKLDRDLCVAYVGDMIRIDLTRFSLSLALLGELITLAVHHRTRERLLAIFRIAQGDSAATVCHELQRDHHTVLKWAHDFNSGGPSALVYKHSGGTPSQLCSLAPLLVDVVEESWSLAALSRVKKKRQRSGSARQSGGPRRHQADRSGNDSASYS